MEINELPVAYHDNSQCWPILRQLVSSLFPIKEIKFNFDIGEFSVKNFKVSFYPIDDPLFQDVNNPLKVYKRPYVYLYILTFSSPQEYRESIKTQVEAFIAQFNKNSEGEDRDEWLIVYTTSKPIASELEYKMHFQNFSLLESEFKEYNQAQSAPRLISVFGFDPKVEIFNVTFDGLYKFSLSFITFFQNSVQQRVFSLEEKVVSMLELKDNQSWNFLKFFALKENIAIIYENLMMYLEAFQKYEELRNKYYESILRKSDKLKFAKQEFYMSKGKENPYLMDIDREKVRQDIFENKITEFDFVQYLFARQARFLKLMNWHQEGAERVKLLISDVFHRSTRELSEIKDQDRYMAFKHIWSIQALHGFIEYFHPKLSPGEPIQPQMDLNFTRMNFKHYVLLHLEQLYELVHGSSIDKIKVKRFTEEFETLLDILEHGGALVAQEIKKGNVDFSQFDIKDPKLREIVANKEEFLEFIYEEKMKYSQAALGNGCKKIAQFKTMECLKYRIEQNKTENVKIEEITSMIQAYDNIKLFEVSDVLRIYLLRVYLQRRTYSELMKPFLLICKHQNRIIQEDFEKKKNRNPFKILNAFCERNIEKSIKGFKTEFTKLKDLSINVDNAKGMLITDYCITNGLDFHISNCKLQVVLKPSDLRKSEDKSHKKLYEKYTWSLDELVPGENNKQTQIKSKSTGVFKVKGFFLKISKFKFKIELPAHVRPKELAIKEENKYTYNIQHKTLDDIMLNGKIPSDNECPLVLVFSDFSFKFEKMRVECEFTSSHSVFHDEAHLYSVNENDELMSEEVIDSKDDRKGSKVCELKPPPEAKVLYLLLVFQCNSRNVEVWDTLNVKIAHQVKNNNITKDYSIPIHFSPLLQIVSTYYNLPNKTFLHVDLNNTCLFPVRIQELKRDSSPDEQEELIEPDTRIEPNEEFSVILDNPKEKGGSLLKGKLRIQSEGDAAVNESFKGLPEFIRNKLKLGLEYKVEYNYHAYLKQREPHYRVTIDFPKTVLYQQSYIMVVQLTLLDGAETKDCEISISDEQNDWLMFGMIKYRVTLSSNQSNEFHFNLIPISVGDVPLPKVSVVPKKGVQKISSTGKKPNLAINLQEIATEPEALPEDKLEFVFSNSQVIQVFNNSMVTGERISKLLKIKKTSQSDPPREFIHSSFPITQAPKPHAKTKSKRCRHLEQCLSFLFRCFNENKYISLSATKSEPLLGSQPIALKGRKTLVLDLDETLVHTSFDYTRKPDIVLPIKYEGVTHVTNIHKRPGVDVFLERVCQLFEVVIFTASLSDYAAHVVKKIDHKNQVPFVLYREACTIVNDLYVKDLSKLGRDLKDIILVDNSANSFILQPENSYHIKDFFGDKRDRELQGLLSFLEYLANIDDVRPISDHRKTFEKMRNKAGGNSNQSRPETVRSEANLMATLMNSEAQDLMTDRSPSKKAKERKGEQEAMRILKNLSLKQKIMKERLKVIPVHSPAEPNKEGFESPLRDSPVRESTKSSAASETQEVDGELIENGDNTFNNDIASPDRLKGDMTNNESYAELDCVEEPELKGEMIENKLEDEKKITPRNKQLTPRSPIDKQTLHSFFVKEKMLNNELY